MDYPKPLRRRHGCKVSWRYYETLEEAKDASKVAREEMIEVEALGYDFGYLTCGVIDHNEDGTYSVVCP
jgi:hypothetical protein